MKRMQKELISLPWLHLEVTTSPKPYSIGFRMGYFEGWPPDDLPFDEGSPNEFDVSVHVLWFGITLVITGKVPKA